MTEGSGYSWYKPHHAGGTGDPYAIRPSIYPPITDQSAYSPNPSTSPPYPPPSQTYPPPQHAYSYGPSYPPYAPAYPPYAPSISGQLVSVDDKKSSHWKNPLLEELRQIARFSFESGDPPDQSKFLAKYGFSDRPASVALPTLQQAVPDFQLFNIFSVVDENRTGYVDFWGLITILYALEFKLFCDNCHELIFGAKFWCEECRVGAPKTPFGLCFSCFQRRKDLHPHQEFLNSHDVYQHFVVAKSEAMKGTSTEQESEALKPQQKDEQMSLLEQQLFIQQQQQQLEMARRLGQMMVNAGNAVNDLAPGYYHYL